MARVCDIDYQPAAELFNIAIDGGEAEPQQIEVCITCRTAFLAKDWATLATRQVSLTGTSTPQPRQRRTRTKPTEGGGGRGPSGKAEAGSQGGRRRHLSVVGEGNAEGSGVESNGAEGAGVEVTGEEKEANSAQWAMAAVGHDEEG